MDIPDDWQPSPENVNALPGPLRRYIHDLETNCDPQGIIRQNIMVRDENGLLRRECENLTQRNAEHEERYSALEAKEEFSRRVVERLQVPITMQDIRLCIGEGRLSAADVLNAANAVLQMRSRTVEQPVKEER